MTRIRKKVLTQTLLLGIIVTFLVVIVDSLGVLRPLDRFFYDRRARNFQFFTPNPTDKIVHANIDDETLQLIGPWPWDRDLFAEILTELRQNGAKTVAMDIIFLEPQNRIWRPKSRAGADQTRTSGADAGPAEIPAQDVLAIDRDAVLAREFSRQKEPVLGVLADPAPIPTTSYLAIYAMLYKDLELSLEEVVARMRGLDNPEKARPTSDDVTRYLAARKFAMRDRILSLKREKPDITREQASALLLPRSPATINSPVRRVFAEQFNHATSISQMFERLPRVPTTGEHSPFFMSDIDYPPITPFTAECKNFGSITSTPDSDGVVRRIPLWTRYKDRLFPQLGLAAALSMMDVNIKDVRFKRDGFIIPLPDGTERFVPTRENSDLKVQGGRSPGYFLDVPWFGATDNYLTMYDPKHERPIQQISVSKIWKLFQIENRIRANNATADEAASLLLDAEDPNALADFNAARTKAPADDSEVRKPFVKRAIEIASAGGYLRPPKVATTDAEKQEETFVVAAHALEAVLRNMDPFTQEANQLRTQLRNEIDGKTVLVGWTASAVIADFVPTSLHGKAPGQTVHGVVFNSVATGFFWRRAPDWLTALAAVLVGLFATLCVASLPAVPSMLASIGLLVLYVVANCLVLFDYGKFLLGVSGPVVVIAAVWSVGTVFRFLIETRELKRITESFQNRVDPALVQYVIENPEKVELSGERRELSVVFTDLAGFTTLSEQLEAGATVAMLNKYMGMMVPIIRGNNGYVNKFLGDGIMFFFGAPREDVLHAIHAVVTVIQMQKVLVEFNRELIAQGLPTLEMRVGISTGYMTVGDAGSIETESRSFDYTVLGDSVNLGARLESANKATGSLMLMTDRTAELMGDSVLARPIGRLVVKGKTKGVMVYEPLAMRDEATPEMFKLAETTQKVVETYQAGQFELCLKAIDEMDAAVGHTKTAELYRTLCVKYLKEPPPMPFDGCITLSEK